MKLFKRMPTQNYLIYSILIVAGIILDQVTKLIVSTNMRLHQSIPVIENVLHITFATNDGAGFGMLDDKRWIFMSVSTVAIIAFSLYLFLGHADGKLFGLSIAMVVSGGIGNMIDRVFLGEVVDFIHTPFVKYPKFTDYGVYWSDFPIYNIADCFVTVGAALLIFALVRSIIKESKDAKQRKGEKK